ncbi:NAD(P)H-dependent oxidoreductase [Nonomuraea sp. NPDC049141]|uniref:NAD(P)H-dependent oxidoreductase n=1 Tax=Nonomuraea sp. NPDC049141 TaxID=3155500 RepID=UPI0033E4F2B3
MVPSGRSCSRAVTDTFRRTWQEHHPEGTVIYRDLTANPLPHLTADAHTAGQSDPASHSLAQAAAFAQQLTLIEELENADAVLIGAPSTTTPSRPRSRRGWTVSSWSAAPPRPKTQLSGIPLFEASRQHALDDAASKAKAVAARFAA